MRLTRRELIASAGIVILGVSACGKEDDNSATDKKNIPEGMSEAAYDMGTEIYELSGDYLSNADGYDTTGAAVQAAIDEYAPNMDIENNKPDERVFMLSTMIAMELTTGEEDGHTKNNVENYLDGLGYTLETGEYSEEFSTLETE